MWGCCFCFLEEPRTDSQSACSSSHSRQQCGGPVSPYPPQHTVFVFSFLFLYWVLNSRPQASQAGASTAEPRPLPAHVSYALGDSRSVGRDGLSMQFCLRFPEALSSVSCIPGHCVCPVHLPGVVGPPGVECLHVAGPNSPSEACWLARCPSRAVSALH